MKWLLLSFLLISLSSFGQQFPEDWIGTYRGDMIIGSIVRPNDTVQVTFKIEEVTKDSSWTYWMSYESKRFGSNVKDYLIVKKNDGNSTSYAIDEKDGIIINSSLINGTFYDAFQFDETMICGTLRYHNESIILELTIINLSDPSISGASEGEEYFEIKVIKSSHTKLYI